MYIAHIHTLADNVDVHITSIGTVPGGDGRVDCFDFSIFKSGMLMHSGRINSSPGCGVANAMSLLDVLLCIPFPSKPGGKWSAGDLGALNQFPEAVQDWILKEGYRLGHFAYYALGVSES